MSTGEIITAIVGENTPNGRRDFINYGTQDD